MQRLKAAHNFAKLAHKGQKRKFTGEPYLIHLEQTAQHLHDATDGRASTDEFMAALLHDVVEDTPIELSEIGRNFGEKVMGMVGELTTDMEEQVLKTKKVYLSEKINKMSEEAFTIKLCDRLSNVSALPVKKVPIEFVDKYVAETIYILENLNRGLNEAQKFLVDKIEKVLIFVKIRRDL